MSKIFGTNYADAYDLLYSEKDYLSECSLVERILEQHAGKKVRSILDLGCGTGNHSIPLAVRGYEVIGVDVNEAMLVHARKKATSLTPESRVKFIQSDIRTLDLKRRFDVCLILFAVLGYQTENDDVLAALKTARSHLYSGGLLMFDVWYGPAVLTQKPAERVKTIPIPDGQILRRAAGELDIQRHLCWVHYHLWRIERGRLTAEVEESHPMRYFFPQELSLFLQLSGFQVIRFGEFPAFERNPDITSWNIMGVARAV